MRMADLLPYTLTRETPARIEMRWPTCVVA
jgi:hypothetical protein